MSSSTISMIVCSPRTKVEVARLIDSYVLACAAAEGSTFTDYQERTLRQLFCCPTCSANFNHIEDPRDSRHQWSTTLHPAKWKTFGMLNVLCQDHTTKSGEFHSTSAYICLQHRKMFPHTKSGLSRMYSHINHYKCCQPPLSTGTTNMDVDLDSTSATGELDFRACDDTSWCTLVAINDDMDDHASKEITMEDTNFDPVHQQHRVRPNVSEERAKSELRQWVEQSSPVGLGNVDVCRSSQFFENNDGDDESNNLDESSRLFFNEQCNIGPSLGEEHLGIRRLVARSFQQSVHINDSNLPSVQEALFHLKVASFCSTLTAAQITMFAEINGEQIQMLGDQPLTQPGCKFSTTLPVMSESDINTFYLESKRSRQKNIPAPRAACVEEKSLVSSSKLIECVQHFCAWGHSTVDLYHKYNKYPAEVTERELQVLHLAKKLSPEALPRLCLFREFQDGIDCQKTVKDRKAAWIKGITFDCLDKSQLVSRSHNFVIAVGSHSGNTRASEREFGEAISTIHGRLVSIYHGDVNKVLPTLIVCLATNNDRVERDKMTQTLSHASPFSRPWNFIGRPSNFDDLIPCRWCHAVRVKRSVFRRGLVYHNSRRWAGCRGKHCSDWSYDSPYLAQAGYSTLGEDYPTVCAAAGLGGPSPPTYRGIQGVQDHPIPGRPVAKTFPFLIQALHFAIFNFVTNTWNKKQTRAYLRSSGIASSLADSLVLGAVPRLVELGDLPSDTAPGFQGNGSLFNYSKIARMLLDSLVPPTWTQDIPMEHYLLAPMHLLKGTVSDFVSIVDKWLTFQKLSSSFRRYGHPLLEKMKNLSIGWLSVYHFGKEGKANTTGSWHL